MTNLPPIPPLDESTPAGRVWGVLQTLGNADLAAALHLDLRQLVRQELASRGANEHGKWIGFSAATGELSEPSAVDEAIVCRIALRSLSLATLETRNSDSLDFKEQSVWGIRNALLCALRAGQEVA